MNERDTPETDDFYATFADGLASPSQDEWLERMKRYERQRDEHLERSASYLGKLADMNIRRHIAESQRDGLLEALERVSRLPGDYDLICDAEWVIRDVRVAIAAVKEGKQP